MPKRSHGVSLMGIFKDFSPVQLSNGLEGTIVNYPNDFAQHPLVRIDQENVVDLNQHKDIKIIEYNQK